MDDSEVLLKGGHNTRVVRVGGTVHRPQGSRPAFVHALLRHLEAIGFDGAPRLLGIDDQGREVLSYLPGQVPTMEEVHASAPWSDDQLAALSGLIRRFHDATAGSGLAGDREVVCHMDILPWNTVFVDERPWALIDFDYAAPGSRRRDLAYAAWFFLRLGPNGLPAGDQARRLRLMVEAYGRNAGDPGQLIDALAACQDAMLKEALRRSTQAGDQADSPLVAWLRGDLAWLRTHRNMLIRALQ
jgi:Ser/Thr protein kinase RdoA (MazF antagonist)